MIVLGLHGWDSTHDAAAALLIDGQAVAMIEEERLSRTKHALSERPVLATHAVLEWAGIGWSDVDLVAYGWDLPSYVERSGRRWPFGNDADFLRTAFGIPQGGRVPGLVWVNHHEAHAAAAFHASQAERAAVLVVDGQGEDKSISLYEADRSSGVRKVRDWGPACSLGLLYEAATRYCGFGFLDAGKTMGLAAFGTAGEPLPIAWHDDDIVSPIPAGFSEDDVTDRWFALLCDRFGTPSRAQRRYDRVAGRLRWTSDEPGQHHPHVAAAAQASIERMMIALVDYARTVTGNDLVVLAGGVALNCVANGLLADRSDDRLFVPPMAHDAGAAVGAAAWASGQAGERPRIPAEARLGVDFTSDDISSVLRQANIRARRIDDPASEAAARIEQGEVIGWFQSRVEVGPRALGARSILASPLDAANKQRVNRIKGREQWRPLAPSALADETGWMFGRPIASPFMLRSHALTAEARQRVPAVAHVDGSTRVQTVDADPQDNYARLLEELRRRTGTGVVLNTSFNAAFEPIVCTPADAIRTFSILGLDALILGEFLLEK